MLTFFPNPTQPKSFMYTSNILYEARTGPARMRGPGWKWAGNSVRYTNSLRRSERDKNVVG